MQFSDLRLDGFIIIPGVSVPPETGVPLSIGFTLLLASIYTLTWHPSPAWSIILRLSLAPLAIYSFLVFGFWPYETNGGVGVDVALAVVGLYWIMRVIETTYVGLFDEKPSHWIVGGEEAPLPMTVLGRLAYSFDLATSLRGNSWFLNTHWDWAPKALINSPACLMSRTQFLLSRIVSLLPQYLALDVLDSIDKSRIWDRSTPYPITSLPWYEQMVFSTSVCAQTVLTITVPYTIISCTCVALGSHPESWPPMFDAPFTATSLADFWNRRWHAIFRRVFSRLSELILWILPIPRSSPKSLAQRTIRLVAIFGFSTSLHMLLMRRIDVLETEHRRAFIDPSILKFFMLQPFGIALEAIFVLPACNALIPASWRSTATRLWTWAFVLWSGRFWSDVWIHRGFWEEEVRLVGWSVVRGVLYGVWAV